MAEQDTIDKVEPSPKADTNTAPVCSANALQSVARHQNAMAASSLNATPAPKLVSDPKLPVLPTTKMTGYERGRPVQVELVKLDGHLIEKNTAYDFLVMRNAAAKDGVAVKINVAFRDMATQVGLWNARMRPAYVPGMRYPRSITVLSEGNRLGPVAFPGWSNHQSGIALDLHTGMTIADRLAGRYSAIFSWLLENAAKFGFDNDDIPRNNPEPWHWRHQEKKFISEALAQDLMREDYYGKLVKTGDAAKAALAKGSLAKTTYDKLVAYERSVKAATSAAQTHYDNNVADKICASAETSKYIASANQLENAASQPKPEFDKTSASPFVYNFETGRWGDKEPV